MAHILVIDNVIVIIYLFIVANVWGGAMVPVNGFSLIVIKKKITIP